MYPLYEHVQGDTGAKRDGRIRERPVDREEHDIHVNLVRDAVTQQVVHWEQLERDDVDTDEQRRAEREYKQHELMR